MGSVARLADAVELIGSESWASKIRKKARSVATTIDAGYMHLAEMLYLIDSTPVNGDPKNGPIYSAWGYTSFAQYAEEELGMHRRRAERLRRIWFDIDIRLADQLDRKLRKRLVALGFGKVREVVRIIDGANAEAWIEMAENLTHKELCAAISKAFEEQEKAAQAAAVGADDDDEDEDRPNPDPPEPVRYKGWTFMLTPDQRENVKLAMERARQLAKGYGMEDPTKLAYPHFLDLICTDFIATNDFRKADDPEQHLRFLAKFERLMNRRLVVIDPVKWRIEYGIDALQKVAEAEDIDE